MDVRRKYAILFSATILAARKLHELGDKPSPAREYAISDAISERAGLDHGPWWWFWLGRLEMYEEIAELPKPA